MNILNKIIKKEATVQQKLTYLLPAIISILNLIDLVLILVLEKVLFRKLIPEFSNLSKFIFLFSGIYAAYKNYDYFKKINVTSILFGIICFFWIYASLYNITLRSFSGFILFAITLIQIYLFLNLYLDIKFNILNTDLVSSSFNLNFFKTKLNLNLLKKKFNLNLLKNKFVIGALILFGVFIFYNVLSENNDNSNFNAENNLRKKAAKAVDAASACYLSVPDRHRNIIVGHMRDVRKNYADGVELLNRDQSYISTANTLFDSAIFQSNIVMQIGKDYGGSSCGR